MVKIGVAGKGGTGKTTLASLILLSLLRMKQKPILAVDADPNSNFAENLGIKSPRSVVEIVTEIEKIKNNLPYGIEKAQYLEIKIQEAIKEEEGFDLLVMGRTEGPGCYCYANNLLREWMSKLEINYKFVVMDNEAGMEHMARRTSGDLDILFIVSLCDKVSLRTAESIYKMINSLQLNIKKVYLVLNEFLYKKNLDNLNFPVPIIFKLPFDEEIYKLSEENKGILNLPEDSIAYIVVSEFIKKLILERNL
ncbi:MAG: AAA family ATPase [Candidatus Omnitrophica bacterium]|nr:AAA family ATPase [Candidatus Omnitrophota bacterium]MCM8808954.1 AAA family ATPase [Candidatus Omnitrophota bacterium]MCM8810239.1 AAA family ATPase [Candidatus Omnitrophota bacterium]MCM8833145.1 AAA family ATPase [Candidatus Omnitrophota bacterium]